MSTQRRCQVYNTEIGTYNQLSFEKQLSCAFVWPMSDSSCQRSRELRGLLKGSGLFTLVSSRRVVEVVLAYGLVSVGVVVVGVIRGANAEGTGIVCAQVGRVLRRQS
jgi:hypothetical protein